MNKPISYGSPADAGTRRAALLSRCGRYRYTLTRTWGDGEHVNWLMLNPSTATADKDDATIRRCVRFARDWGYGGIVVTNLFAWRATNPRELLTAFEPIGPDNDEHIALAARGAGLVVCAWGARGGFLGRDRAVLELLERCGAVPHMLRLTTCGRPCHPLRLPASLQPRLFLQPDG